MPKPPHKPTAKQRKYVYDCVCARIPQKNICAALGLDPKTLKKHYSKEIREGRNYLPQLATNKIVEFLELKAPQKDRDIRREQATLAYKVMSRHGWSEQVDVKADRPLVKIITKRLPEDKDDV